MKKTIISAFLKKRNIPFRPVCLTPLLILFIIQVAAQNEPVTIHPKYIKNKKAFVCRLYQFPNDRDLYANHFMPQKAEYESFVTRENGQNYYDDGNYSISLYVNDSIRLERRVLSKSSEGFPFHADYINEIQVICTDCRFTSRAFYESVEVLSDSDYSWTDRLIVTSLKMIDEICSSEHRLTGYYLWDKSGFGLSRGEYAEVPEIYLDSIMEKYVNQLIDYNDTIYMKSLFQTKDGDYYGYIKNLPNEIPHYDNIIFKTRKGRIIFKQKLESDVVSILISGLKYNDEPVFFITDNNSEYLAGELKDHTYYFDGYKFRKAFNEIIK